MAGVDTALASSARNDHTQVPLAAEAQRDKHIEAVVAARHCEFAPVVRAAVRVYGLQVSRHYVQLDLIDDDEVGCLMHLVREETCCEPNPDRVLPVEPQPAVAHVACIIVPSCDHGVDRVPIFVQILGQHERRYMTLLPPTITLGDVAKDPGPLWPSGGVAFIGASEYPLDPHLLFAPAQGSLLTVLPPGVAVSQRISTKQKLRQLVDGCLSAEPPVCEGLQEEATIGIVGPLADWSTVPGCAFWDQASSSKLCAECVAYLRDMLPSAMFVRCRETFGSEALRFHD